MNNTNLRKKTLKEDAPLTKREKEVLHWLAQGKTLWETSRILNVTEATISFHIKNINHKLGSVNRCQSVALAVRDGLI